MGSLKKRVGAYVAAILFLTILIVTILCYISFRGFILELTQGIIRKQRFFSYFPVEMGALSEQLLNRNFEVLFFAIFLEKFQPLLLLLTIGSIIVIVFSVSIVNFFMKQMLKELNHTLAHNDEDVPKELQGVQQQMLIYSEEINELQNQNRVFQGYASHELRNDLAKLRGLYEKYDVVEPEIIGQQEQIEETISSLLVLASLSSDFSFIKIDLLLEIANMIDEFSVRLNCTLEYDEDIEYILYAKKTWIVRMLYNLLDNVYKYSDTKAANITLRLVNQEFIVLSVQNTIADKTRKILTQETENNGIGLALVEQIVTQLHGVFYTEVYKGNVNVIMTFKINETS